MNWSSLRIVLVALTLTGCFASARPTPPLAIPGKEFPSDSFKSPLVRAEVLSRFGGRGRRYHTGLDIRGRRGGGDPVYAARDGRVTQAKTWRGYGKMITIRHSDGFTSRYAHLQKFLVKEGDRVKTGTPIGIVGATGRASTAHLHFEVLTPTGRFMDPYPLLF